MLVLSRNEGEALLIGDALVMVVMGSNGRLKLAIDAPREMRISRTEILPPEEQARLHRRVEDKREARRRTLAAS